MCEKKGVSAPSIVGGVNDGIMFKESFKTFSTSPKFRRRVKPRCISGKRAKLFMEHLWRKGIRECSYKRLVIEFVQFFETNDKRVIEKYLGRPEKIERHSATSVVRMNRLTGKIAHFQYSNERRIPGKKGLMEILGYISILDEEHVLIHHDFMPYYTKQVKLEEVSPLPFKKNNACEGVSGVIKKDLCVCSIEAGERKTTHSLSNPPNPPKGGNKKEKKEEVIDCTHTNLFISKYASRHTEYALDFLESLKKASREAVSHEG